MSLSRAFLTAALAVVIPATASMAQDYADWLPPAITLPPIEEVLMDQAIGAQTRILQIVTPADPVALMPAWIEALTAAGYETNDSMLFDGRLLFAGEGIESGQIAILPNDGDGLHYLQVDITLAE